MIKTIALAFGLTLSASIPALDIVVDEVVSVYDADTFKITQRDWPDIIGKELPVRVRGVDAPEIRGKCQLEKLLAVNARDFVRRELAKAKKIELLNVERGKYFRLVADVVIDGHYLDELLIENKLGRDYHGGKREGWCD